MADNVGSILGVLKLDATQFHAEIEKAVAELEALSGKDVKIKVELTGLDKVAAEAAAADAALDGLDESTKKVDRTAKGTGPDIHLLGAAIIGLVPTIVPIAAAAAGFGAAFIGMGAAGVAAFFGIKQEMAAGTATGVAYTRGIDDLKTGFSGLARVAAGNVLGSFESVVSTIKAELPGLTSEVGGLATVTGKTAVEAIDGLIGGFKAFGPLMDTISIQVLHAMTSFDSWNNGNGVKGFASYLTGIMPQVEADLGAVATATGHLIQAFSGLGLGSLSILRMLSSILSAIPVDVLTVLAQDATAVYFGFKTWSILSSMIHGVSDALLGMNADLAISKSAMLGFNLAFGVIGAGIAILSVLFAHNGEAAQATAAQVGDYTSALEASNGAINDNIRATTVKALTDAGAFEQAKQFGISQAQLTDAVLAGGPAVTALTDKVNSYTAAQAASMPHNEVALRQQGQLVDTGNALNGTLTSQAGAFATAKGNQADYNAAMKTGNVASDQAAAAEARHAAALGMTVPAFEAATAAAQKDGTQADATRNKMILEGDAAGILKADLDALSGKALSAAQAQNQFESSLNALTKRATGAAITLKGMSSASVTLRGNILQNVTAAEADAEATARETGSNEAGRQKLIALRTQIINNAVAHGVNRASVTRYIDSVLSIPAKETTNIVANTSGASAAVANFKRTLESINGKTVYTYIRTVATGDKSPGAQGMAHAGPAMRHGGFLSFAKGDIVQSFATGSLPTSATIAPDGANLVQWAERGTGGEAFIPLGPDNRSRSLDIWAEAGRRMGVSPNGGGQGSPRVQVNVVVTNPFTGEQVTAQTKSVVVKTLASHAAQSAVNARQMNGVQR